MALPKFGKDFRSTAIAGGFAAMMAVLPAAAANADDMNSVSNVATAQTVDYSQINVPVRDARGAQEAGVKMAAAMQSADAQVVIFFSDNFEAYKATMQALKEIIAEDSTAFKGMYIGDPVEAVIHGEYQVNSTQEIVTYADGQKTSIISNPDGNVGEAIKDQLREDYKNIIIPRRNTVALNTEAPDLAAN